MKNLFSHHSSVRTQSVTEKLLALAPTLSRSEARLANFIVANIGDLAFETGASLARKMAVSEITVSRFLRKAGYKGIAGLKRELRGERGTEGAEPVPVKPKGQASPYASVRELEVRAMSRAFEQFETNSWKALVSSVARAREVYVTGFQSVRGTAEDFSRRLSLARNSVRFVSAHDGMLGEWLAFQGDARPKPITLVLIDVVPYAREGLKVAEIAKEMGLNVVVVSDEFCDWAHGLADHSISAKSRSGLFLESTVSLVLILNVLVDAVARSGPGKGKSRFDTWQLMTRRINIF